jgi:hypothetical protein
MGVNVGRKEEINKNKSVCSNNIVKVMECITMSIIQFNSILYYLCAEPTARRPITGTAQCRYR